MGRPAKWSGPTTAIRVPAALADQLLDIARQLQGSFVQNSSAPTVATFEGPYLVTVNETSYLVEPPPVLVGEEADTVNQLVDELTAEMSEKDLALLVARLAEEWGRPIGSSR